ncbi:MAG: GDSL-type esterase/lipase family protein [Verrucomicrobiales bacterium]|jgi:azurin|nr:GDSL-type esterase/lipase family protein [Verrucomicrobiales bacterium]
MRNLIFFLLLVVTAGQGQHAPGIVDDKKDAKYQMIDKPEPPRDPALAAYGIYAENAPTPEKGAPATTKLPLVLEKGDRIAFVGNTLLDRGGQFGFFESMLYQAHPDLDLEIRNFAWSADEVDLQPRPDNFATVAQHLTREEVDVIFAAFGYNESFGGIEALPAFRERLTAYLTEMKASLFNGETGPKIVLISPIANEDIASVPGAAMNNERLALYVEAMEEVAAEMGVGFANVFVATRTAFDDPGTDLTINGAHMTEDGYEVFAEQLFSETFDESPPQVNEQIRELVVDKNRQYQRRYRPVNSFYYTGGRKKDYGYLDFLPAMRNFELMTTNREAAIHALSKNPDAVIEVDDSTIPPLDAVVEARGANEWMSPADELAAFQVDPRFEVSAFATEEEFPEIACPIAMRWDSRGRLWVSTSKTYPHVYPGDEPNDTIVILEDTDQDGKADHSTVFAEGLHIPLSFVLTDNGCYVSDQPHLLLLEDTDGDDRADRRTQVLTGFGTEDSHHSLHDFVWTPDGDLIFRESIFHNSQVETAYGPVRAKNSAWFRFTPRTQRLVSFGSYPNTNPWGVTFDDWGNHVASHPIFASAFHSLNPLYPEQQPKAAGIPAYSGVCGHEFVDFPMWPEEMQGGMVKVRYKPTNRVEFHQWVRHDDHYTEEYVSDLIFSTNLSFIPVDLRFGPRGAMYICDWYNPVKGHAQYSLRDPRRDRESGRIWRIVPKGAELQDPPAIDGAPIPALLENLKRREYRYRYWSKRELQFRDPEEVVSALDEWVQTLDPDADRYDHHRLEALWSYRRVGAYPAELVQALLASPIADARAAATRQLRYGQETFADGGLSLLAQSANDEDGIVRMEAVIAATYFGTREALEAVTPVFGLPMEAHLKFAAHTALISEALAEDWKGDPDFAAKYPAVIAAYEAWGVHEKMASSKSKRTAQDADFDSQKDLFSIEINCVPERMMFDKTAFTVKAGQPVKLVLVNPDATQHNLVMVKPGAVEEVGMAGNEMAKDPKGFSKGFIPESDKILHHTKLLEPDTAEVLRFKAPKKPGVYPYLCTFPGHWIIMKGEMTVE